MFLSIGGANFAGCAGRVQCGLKAALPGNIVWPALSTAVRAKGVDANDPSLIRMPGREDDMVTESPPPQDSCFTFECDPKTLTAIFTGPDEIPAPAPSWTLDRVKQEKDLYRRGCAFVSHEACVRDIPLRPEAWS